MRSSPQSDRPTNLPAALTGFVGRVTDMQSVDDLLARSRLTTITGSAGFGKTRLAVEVARRRQELQRDGVFFVDLASISNPDLLPGTVAAALQPPQDAASLRPYLRNREILLVLDNAEHLIEAVADFAASSIAESPSLTLLVTSREPLGVMGEAVWRLSELEREDAVALFLDRARSAAANSAVDASDADSTAELCRRLDGIPLAIELAATRLRLMSVTEMLAGLDESIAAIGGRIRAAPERHRTLRAAFDWSYRLLEADEQRLFRELGVFAGGFDAEAVLHVCGAAQVVLESLVEKSLVTRSSRGDQPARFDMLETLRSYAAELLVENSEAEAARERHAQYFAALAERAESGLYGPQQHGWVRRVEADVDNFRAAIAWTLDHDPTRALAMTGALFDFFGRTGRSREGLALVKRALDLTSDESVERVRALVAEALLTGHAGDFERVAEVAGRATAMARKVGNPHRLATALSMVGAAANARGDSAEAEEAFREMHEAAIAAHDGGLQAVALNGMAVAAWPIGEHDRAMELISRAKEAVRPVSDLDVLVYTLDLSAGLKMMAGDVAGARADWLEALSVTDTRYERAETFFILSGLALVEGLQGNRSRALRLAAASERMQEEMGGWSPGNFWESGLLNLSQETMARLRQEAGPAQVARELEMGRAMQPWEAAALAASPVEPDGEQGQRSFSQRMEPLSRRESEVALLVADGLTSRQIAARLHLAERTIENHVQSALNKLNLNSRAQLAAWTARHASGTQVHPEES